MKQLIASTISDSQFMKIHALTTAHVIWTALAKEFENKSRMVSVDLRRRLHEMRCGERDDVREHFAKMRTVREDLSAMGHPPSDEDFYAIVFGSMPASYEPYISSISATSIVTGTVLTPDRLMDALTEEYERRSLCAKSKGSKTEGGESALSTHEKSGNGKGKGRRGGGKGKECY